MALHPKPTHETPKNELVAFLLYDENKSFLLSETKRFAHRDEVLAYIYSKNWSDKIVREHPIASISFYGVLGLFSVGLVSLLVSFGFASVEQFSPVTISLDNAILFISYVSVTLFLAWVGFTFCKAVYLILRFKRQDVSAIHDAIADDYIIVEGAVKRVKPIPSGRRIHYRYAHPSGKTEDDYFVTDCQCVALGYAEKNRQIVVAHHSDKYNVVL